jgi:hypothetical protein
MIWLYAKVGHQDLLACGLGAFAPRLEGNEDSITTRETPGFAGATAEV